MDEMIKFSFTNTLRYSIRGAQATRGVRYFIFIFIFVFALVISYLCYNPYTDDSYNFIPFIECFFCALIGYGVLIELSVIFGVWHQLRRTAFKNIRYEWAVTDENLNVITSHSHSQILWSAFCLARLKQDGIALFITRRQVYWFPKAAFQSEADFDRLIALARAKIADFKPKR